MKRILYTLLTLICTTASAFAVNVADSDLSNTAGSNIGKSNVSAFVLVVLFLILAATAPLYTKKRS